MTDDLRSIRVVQAYDVSLNPTSYSFFLRDDGDLVLESHHVFDAFVDWHEAENIVRAEMAKALLEVGWWA